MKFKMLVTLIAMVAVVAGVKADIKIVKAIYGFGEQTKDVTEIAKDKLIVIADRLVLLDVNNSFFTDPAPGKPKTLELTYSEDGVEKTASIKERGQFVHFKNMEPSKEFKVILAFYGVGDKWNDVTAKIIEACDEGSNVNVDNTVLGPDPGRGKAKSLVVAFSENDQVKVVRVGEKQVFKPESIKKK